jgi:hypothetical protein
MIFMVTVACGKGGTSDGNLGGLSSRNTIAFLQVKAQLEDSKFAYNDAMTNAHAAELAPPVSRASAMSQQLKGNRCPLHEAQPTSESFHSSWEGRLHLAGAGCPVDALEQRSFTRNATSGTFNLLQAYSVQTSDYQRLNPLKQYLLNGGFRVDKYATGTETNGSFKLSLKSDIKDASGNIDLWERRQLNSVQGEFTFTLSTSELSMTAKATWSGAGNFSAVQYAIQGRNVAPNDFNNALAPFAVPEIMAKLNQIPDRL